MFAQERLEFFFFLIEIKFNHAAFRLLFINVVLLAEILLGEGLLLADFAEMGTDLPHLTTKVADVFLAISRTCVFGRRQATWALAGVAAEQSKAAAKLARVCDAIRTLGVLFFHSTVSHKTVFVPHDTLKHSSVVVLFAAGRPLPAREVIAAMVDNTKPRFVLERGRQVLVNRRKGTALNRTPPCFAIGMGFTDGKLPTQTRLDAITGCAERRLALVRPAVLAEHLVNRPVLGLAQLRAIPCLVASGTALGCLVRLFAFGAETPLDATELELGRVFYFFSHVRVCFWGEGF